MDERPPPQRPVSGEDAMLTFALLIGIAIAGGWFLWHRCHSEIATCVIAAQRRQMAFVAHFTARYATLDRQTMALDPATVSARTLYRICHMVGLYFRIPTACAIAGLAMLCLVRNAPSRFTRVHSLDSLTRVQSKVFRTIAAFADRDLRPIAIAKGEPRPLDVALHAREWVEYYARREDGSFDEEGATRELTQQLGPLWRSVESAPPLVRCLLAHESDCLELMIRGSAVEVCSVPVRLGTWETPKAPPRRRSIGLVMAALLVFVSGGGGYLLASRSSQTHAMRLAAASPPSVAAVSPTANSVPPRPAAGADAFVDALAGRPTITPPGPAPESTTPPGVAAFGLHP